ncbi:MAG: tetratricopeptide repeat protein [Candidatus Obscuribacterales bacterium]|nr:tetratricopeptide repeat protein [Candidatus Obscuribacterales bacterium]
MIESRESKLCELYMRTADKALQEGDVKRAETILSDAVDEMESFLSEPAILIAGLKQRLADVYREQGRYVESNNSYNEALSIVELERDKLESNPAAQTAKYDYFSAGILEGHATCLCEEGRFEESTRLRERAIELLEKHGSFPSVQVTRRKLAATYLVCQEYENAKRNYGQLLRIAEEKYGCNHPDVAELLTFLALTNYFQGNYNEAEELYLKAFKSQQSEGNPQAVWTANELGLSLCAQGKHSLAKSYCHQALETREQFTNKVSMTEREKLANELSELADVYCAKDGFEEATPLCRQALACRLQIAGLGSLELNDKLQLYAYLLRKSGRDSEAIRIETLAEKQSGGLNAQ